MVRARGWFKRLHPMYKGLIAVIPLICTVVGTLLALNVIQPVGENALAAGADRFVEAETAAIAVTFESTAREARATEFDAEGQIDYRTGYGRFFYYYSATARESPLNRVEVRFRRGHVYMRLGPDPRRPWVHADLAHAHEQIEDYALAAGLDAPGPELASLAQLDFNDPSQVLSQLRRASDVTPLGEDRVLGVVTDKYRAEIKPRGRGSPRLIATAWIDGDDLIRKLVLTTDDEPVPFEMTMVFSDFGKPVAVRVPSQTRVTELEDLLARLLA